MKINRRNFIKTSGVAGAAFMLSQSSTHDLLAADRGHRPLPAPDRRKVIYDQDNNGPMGTDMQGLLMLLQADNVDLLGITLVAGDQWVKQEMAWTLRLLELMDRTEVPVFAGAEFPMINNKEEALLRYQLYGGHRLDPWLGAFNSGNWGPNEVRPLTGAYERFAQIKPREQHATHFIIEQVRKYPNEVIIYTGGPLTNLALAIKLAPDIVPLVPEVVFMGTGVEYFTSAFNVFFDAEAAKIVLRTPWPKATVVTVDLGEQVHAHDELRPGRLMIDEIVDRAASPIKELFTEHVQKPYRRNPSRGFRMPDEMISAQIIEPSIFTKSEEMYVDITTGFGPRYGDSIFWAKDWNAEWKVRGTTPQWYTGPPPSAGLVNVLMDLDRDRFKQLYVELMTKPIRKP